MKMPTQKPKVKYSKALAKKICRQIAKGKTLHQVCSTDEMPAVCTVMDWCVDKDEFAELYSRARIAQAHILVDEIISISDDSSEDEMETEEGRKKVNHENIQRDRLRVDSRKWYASKVLPKIYGDKLAKELSGPNGGPIETTNKSVEISKSMDAKEASRIYKEFSQSD